MARRTRLIFLSATLVLLVVVARVYTGSFAFIINDFWFTAGFLLLVLFSLVDQPFFSNDSNVFLNAIAAGISLQLVEPVQRTAVWWTFLALTLYLILSSYVLMWIRAKKLDDEPRAIQFVARANRLLGSPEVLFSAFFIWGIVNQFSIASNQFNALLLFWGIFILLRYPTMARYLNAVFDKQKASKLRLEIGTLDFIVSPRMAEVSVDPFLQTTSIVGKK